MATYVMSDIHGCYTEFQTLLKKTGFDPEKDELIIAGDIVDRGAENYEMLEYAASKPEGVTFLMGNHDQDFILYCHTLVALYRTLRDTEDEDLCSFIHREDVIYPYLEFVRDRYDTVRYLLEEAEEPLTTEDFERWAGCMEQFPYYVRRKVNGKRYIIVHAGYISEEDYREAVRKGTTRYPDGIEQFYVWAREEGLRYGEEGTTVIFGHTPTIAEHDFFNHGRVMVRKRRKKRFINIDCGCVFRKQHPEANLACIRLEDEKVFYLR